MDRVLSPYDRFIKKNGKRHRIFMKNGLMSIPDDLDVVIQRTGHLAIVKKNLPYSKSTDEI
jgi:hypothetical protein